MWRQGRVDRLVFTQAHEATLRGTVVSRQGPGSIVADFEMLLAFVDEMDLALTGERMLRLRVLEPLNARMRHPLQHDLRRPQQKSFPHINGLYWLLRASGLTSVDERGQRAVLVVEEAVRASWDGLNATERYCTLLETWLLRAWPEIIGEEGAGYRVYHGWRNWRELFLRVPAEGLRSVEGEPLREALRYWPGLHNLALMELFGLVQIAHGVPVAGQGWQIESVTRTGLGDALLALLAATMDDGKMVLRERPGDFEVGRLQGRLQPFFPAWQKNLVVPRHEYQEGVFVFRVAPWTGVWRRIAMPAEGTLAELSGAILVAYEFDDDHLHEFIYTNRFGIEERIVHSSMEEGPWTSEVRVGDVPLRVGMTMVYHFDFGDNWRFDVTLERVEAADGRIEGPTVLERRGEAPAQYGGFDEDEEEWG